MTDLRTKYRVEDLGRAKRIIGWTIHRNGSAVHISQPQLTATFIQILNMEKSNPKPTPYASGLNLGVTQTDEPILKTSKYAYATTIGVLPYLVDSTRPDLEYITGALARHMSKPTQRHLKIYFRHKELRHMIQERNSSTHIYVRRRFCGI